MMLKLNTGTCQVMAIMAFGLAVTDCSQPTESINLDTQHILSYLYEVPTITPPPITAQNQLNEGFILTQQYCGEVSELLTRYLIWIQRIEDEAIVPTQVKYQRPPSIDTLRIYVAEVDWVLLHEDGISTFNLHVWIEYLGVSGEDTFPFEMVWSGPAYAESHPDTISGYISPLNTTGIIDSYDWMIKWAPLPARIGFLAIAPGWTAAVSDSIHGGGHMTRQVGLGLNPFYAYWDTLGHGQYWVNSTYGDW